MALQPTVTSFNHDHRRDIKSRFVGEVASGGCRLEPVGGRVQAVEVFEGGRS
jgi:hypothetical protein